MYHKTTLGKSIVECSKCGTIFNLSLFDDCPGCIVVKANVKKQDESKQHYFNTQKGALR